MEFLADLHIHSRFSRATSRSLNLPELHAWAQRKGLFLLGTGDVTHPAWYAELADQLVEAEPGLYRLRDDLAREADAAVPAACRGPVRFVLQGEVSCIYKHDGAVRKVHHVVFLPHLEAAGRFLSALDRLGNVRSDGRPILGLTSRQVLEILLDTAPGAFLVPAHVWTPWFSILGSRSGYDSVEACFGDLAGEIFALETGLSSDPAMNWRVSALDRFALISCSDAHSAANLGREACRFDLADPSFEALRRSLEDPGRPGLWGTLEFFPEEGKYHLDGHRKCGVRLTPAETRETGGRCPECGGKVTVGVLHRVEELADRPPGERPEGARPYQTLVPLAEVVAEALGVGPRTKRVAGVLDRLARKVGPELTVLLRADPSEVDRCAGPVVAEAVVRVREGRVHVEGGYDGEFGVVRIFEPDERREIERQGSLFTGLAELPRTGRRRKRAAPPRPEPEPEARPDTPAGGLDPDQARAVEAPAGPVRIVAGPGTGKTRTLVARIAHRIRSTGVSPHQVLAVTFTNRAAAELAERLGRELAEGAQGVTVGTLHRLGLEILRREHRAAGLPEGFSVVDRDEAVSLVAKIAGVSGREARALAEEISRARRVGLDGAPEVVRRYEEALLARGAVDLDGLVCRAAQLLEDLPAVRQEWQRRWAFVAVDEFQDLDPAQYQLLRLLAPPGGDLTVIGDPDQSIYGFRGADPGLFDRFGREEPALHTVRLGRTYRCVEPVVRAARAVLGPGAPDLAAVRGPGPEVRLVEAATDRDEAEWIAREVERLVGGTSHRAGDGALRRVGGYGFGEVAVLVRTRAQAPLIAEALGRAGFPVQRALGDGFLAGPGRRLRERLRRAAPAADPLEALSAALEAEALEPEDPAAAAWTAAAAGAGTVAELLDRVALAEAGDEYRPGERVTVLTLHAAKGLEFPVVFVAGCEDGLLPYRAPGRGSDPGEERRLLYVGMTRARDVLVLTRARRRRLYGETRRPGESPFLAGVDLERTTLQPFTAPTRQLTLF